MNGEMYVQNTKVSKLEVIKVVLVTVMVGCFSALAWQLTMAGDDTPAYAAGMYYGHYSPGQITWCGAIVVISAALGASLLQKHWYLLPFSAATGFALAFGKDVSSDVTGLWLVGTVFAFIGIVIGISAVCLASVGAIVLGKNLWRTRQIPSSGSDIVILLGISLVIFLLVLITYKVWEAAKPNTDPAAAAAVRGPITPVRQAATQAYADVVKTLEAEAGIQLEPEALSINDFSLSDAGCNRVPEAVTFFAATTDNVQIPDSEAAAVKKFLLAVASRHSLEFTDQSNYGVMLLEAVDNAWSLVFNFSSRSAYHYPSIFVHSQVCYWR
ncbi:MAG: hypothetical protein ACRCSF_06580 [Mycobacteriaceae bacterium]